MPMVIARADAARAIDMGREGPLARCSAGHDT